MRNWEYTPAIAWLEEHVMYFEDKNSDGSIRYLAFPFRPLSLSGGGGMFTFKGSYDSGSPMKVTWSAVSVSSLLDVARI